MKGGKEEKERRRTTHTVEREACGAEKSANARDLCLRQKSLSTRDRIDFP